MKPKDYLIEFNKLRTGINEFEFSIDDRFLAGFDFSPVKRADVNVSLQLFKSEHVFDLKFRFKGTAQVECDTCLAEINFPLDTEYDLLIKLSESEKLTDDEIIYISKQQTTFDLTQYLYESFLLAIPVRHSCEGLSEPKPCNKEVLAKLEQPGKEKEDEPDKGDPRWAKLKGLFNN